MRTFESYNPLAVAVFFLSASFVAMFSMNPVILSVSLFGALLFCFLRNGFKNPKYHLFSLLLFIVMTVINPLVNHNGGTVLFVMNDNPVTLEAFIYGVVASVMIIAVLYWFRSFTEIMTSDKLLYIFGALSPRLALVLSMALRFVPLFSRQIKKTEQTQKALGLYKDDNIIDTFRGKLSIFSIVVTWALENGIITADSMTARGYGIKRRSRYSVFRWSGKDVALLVTTVVLLGLTLFGIYGNETVYYPYVVISEITPVNLTGYIGYGLLVLIPSIIEIKEALRWKFSESKI